MRRSDRDSIRRRYLSIFVCIGLGISLGVWHNRLARRGRGDAVTSIVRTVTSPFVGGATATNRWFGRQLGWLVHGRTLAAENARLREENARLREANAKLVEADISLQRLRKQMGFQQQPPSDKLAADVISLRPNPDFETLLVARGSRDGVKAQSVVATPAGLVGRVYDVAPTTSAVLLITDSNSSVGAMVQRAGSRSIGVCRGNGSNLLSMLYLDRDADVRVGDVIVSSGLGGRQGVFPKGIVIGTVSATANDASGSARRVSVRPSADMGRLEEVFILP